MKSKEYIFQSERLGYRDWTTNDLREFSQINADQAVMEHFPNALSEKETEHLLQRLKKQYDEKGYTYYATEVLETGELIGFIGLAYQTYETPFNPATDIGWRLKKTAWGKGYATEGARKCLAYAFDELNMERVVSTCTLENKNSEKIMRKIGMSKKGVYKHPALKNFPAYENCVWYEINKEQYEDI